MCSQVIYIYIYIRNMLAAMFLSYYLLSAILYIYILSTIETNIYMYISFGNIYGK